MLVFEEEVAAQEAEFERLERRFLRVGKSRRVIKRIGRAGVLTGAIAASFNGLVPLVGSIFGVTDTWGRPEFIADQAGMALVCLLGMGLTLIPLSIIEKRTGRRVDELEALGYGEEAHADAESQSELPELSDSAYRKLVAAGEQMQLTESKSNWKALADYGYGVRCSCCEEQLRG